jgi:hypothetical protein
MNKEYFIENDRVHVQNEKGDTKYIPNCDNLDELLVQENILEAIEKKIIEQESLKQDLKTNNSHLRVDIINGLFVTIAPFIVTLLLKIFGVNIPIYETIFGKVSSTIYCASLMLIASTLRTIYDAIRDQKINKRNKEIINGANLSLNYLNKVHHEEELKLKKLKKYKKEIVNHENKDNTKVIDSPRIKEIEKVKVVNYKLGKKFMKYYRSYLSGTLHFELEKEHDINNMDLYYDLIEEYGPKLVKNFRHTDMY